MEHNNIIFTDELQYANPTELCDAKFIETKSNLIFGLVCSKGKLAVEGDIKTQFHAYLGWCKGCKRKKVVNRAELKEAFSKVAENIRRTYEDE